MTLLQIVPKLAPAIEGVGGYAAALGRALAGLGIGSRFLAADGAWPETGEPAGVSDLARATDLAGAPIGRRSAATLARLLTARGAGVVLLHYVNYGYERRGCPLWLVGGVARWRAGAPGRRLVTYFHEVYASGPPWRSSFWASPAQRLLAARLLRASDGAATSLALYGRMLARWRPAPPVLVTPVFSTVGEPSTVPRPGERRPRAMLVFGGAGNRRRAYGELRDELTAACRALSIAEILDVGPPLAELPALLDGLPVRALGVLPEEEVSGVLLRSYAGFLGYPAPMLAKSTVFAAYCAHGLVPVCAWARRRSGSAAELPPCWEPGREPVPPDPAGLAARARAWYAGHDLAHQAAGFRALLTGAVEAQAPPPGAVEAVVPAAAGASRRPAQHSEVRH
jgi:hypothetical protein